MNQVATRQPTRLERFQGEVLPPEQRTEIFGSLPRHIKPERFERNLANALMQNPDLMDLDPRLVFREVSKAAALGLYLDPQLGEAYLIAAWNGKARRKEPQLRIGYRGLIKLGRQSGDISMIYAHEVHANDYLDVDQGAEKKLVHKPDLFGDRGPLVGYYAVVKYKDGDFDFEPLTIRQAHEIRDRSDGWRAFSEGKIKSTPWSTDEVEMSKKTAIRRLTKRVPQSPELAEAIRIEDAAEHSGGIGHNGGPALEYGRHALTPPPPPPPPNERSEAETIDAEAVDETGKEERHDEPAETRAEEDPDTTDQSVEAPLDPNEVINFVEDEMNAATDQDDIDARWAKTRIEEIKDRHPDDYGIALSMKRDAEKRVNG